MRIVVGIVLGLVTGLVLAPFLLRGGSRGTRRAGPELAESPADSPAARAAPSPAASTREPARDDAPDPRETSAAPLIPDALRDWARAEIELGWASVRQEPLPGDLAARAMETFERAVLETPRRLGVELGESRALDETQRRALGGDDPIALLDVLAAGGLGPQPELVGDAERFERLFPRRGGPSFDGTRFSAREPLVDGSTLVFPAGVFRVRELMPREAFARDVTVRGASMDATLLVLGDLSTRSEVVNLAFVDCTVFTDNGSLTDLRHRPSSLRFERVRVIGFDSGAGGSSLLDAPGLALLARNSRFEGGYGRASDGTLFDVRSDALVARFEGCWIDRVELRLQFLRAGATVAFVGCRLTDVLDREIVERFPHPGVTLQGTTIEYFERGPDRARRPEPKDLEALFPGWRDELGR